MNYRIMKQHTLEQEVWCRGIGLHTGLRIFLKLKPAPENHGIRFCRTDIFDHPTIPAYYNRIVNTFQATTIGVGGVAVSTIEHLMAALYASGIDNALVEVNGPEVPIFDGSAGPYLKLIEKAGVLEQDALRRFLSIKRPIITQNGDSYIKAIPSDQFRIRYLIDFPHPMVGKQELSWTFENGSFGDDIAQARTFGFLKDIEKLQTLGMVRGGSLSNAVVFGDDGLLNVGGFRYADECVRHKILDFIGDLALTGMAVMGSFEIRKAGHALHSLFLNQIMTRPGMGFRLTPTPAAYIPASAVSAIAGRLPQNNLL